ncbi:MAG: hypothetical protein IJU50_06945 [Lachnospiraceae bacterium]|nr:hypothetical protein [Lachnospiraceae bacterium]
MKNIFNKGAVGTIKLPLVGNLDISFLKGRPLLEACVMMGIFAYFF